MMCASNNFPFKYLAVTSATTTIAQSPPRCRPAATVVLSLPLQLRSRHCQAAVAVATAAVTQTPPAATIAHSPLHSCHHCIVPLLPSHSHLPPPPPSHSRCHCHRRTAPAVVQLPHCSPTVADK